MTYIHPLEQQNNGEQLEASPVFSTKKTPDATPVIPGNNPSYGRPANGMTDELNQLWVDELGQIMVAE